MDTTIPADGEAVARACSLSPADAAWFARHQERTHRLRPIDPAEAEVFLAPDATHIVVVQLRPGVRVRRPVRILGTLPDSDAVLARLAQGETVVVGPGGRA